MTEKEQVKGQQTGQTPPQNAGTPAPPSSPPPQPRPQAPPLSQAKPPTVAKPQSPSKRNFLKVITVAGGILGITPFIPFGSFFTATAGGAAGERQRIMKTDGAFANVNNVIPDSGEVFVFPRTGDPKLDAEPFRRYQLIRLSEKLGGDANEAASFRVFSMVCVHLWCLWDYKDGREVEAFGEKLVGNIECPCHGSNYSVLNGKAFAGPAALQTPPNDALPTLPIEVDSDGFIWVLLPNRSLNGDGVIGLGRYV